jgi:hypothetical protein
MTIFRTLKMAALPIADSDVLSVAAFFLVGFLVATIKIV